MKKYFVISFIIGIFIVLLLGTYFITLNNKNMGNLIITSNDFQSNQYLGDLFSCLDGGGDLIPEINISNIPDNTKSLAIVIDDPDAPSGTWVHFLGWDIKTNGNKELKLFENHIDSFTGMIKGTNSFKRLNRGGPCPPLGSGVHRYFFKIYALNIESINLPEGSTKDKLLSIISQHTLSYGEIVGLFKR
nr:YbhB/YbcL family Raf kinase inhibitor-like protein [Candidatus Gracilibacteria bacterium]